MLIHQETKGEGRVTGMGHITRASGGVCLFLRIKTFRMNREERGGEGSWDYPHRTLSTQNTKGLLPNQGSGGLTNTE